MLHRGVDDAPTATAGSRPEQPAVHGVGAGRGEGDLVGSHAEALGDDGPGVVEQQSRRPGGAVEAPGIGVPLGERGLERVPRGRVQRLGGRRVEVRGSGAGRALLAVRHTRNICHIATRFETTPSTQGPPGVPRPIICGVIPIVFEQS